MLKLTNIHIEEIRSFFLASNEEDMLNIQKNIRPSYLSNFLPQLRQLFNSKHLNETELVSIAKNMGAAEHLESLKEIKQDYYSRLANLFHSGITNGDIETLLLKENTEFLEEVKLQNEIKISFRLSERASLKRKFHQLDQDYELTDNEISRAFMLNERERLKSEFQKDDQTEALVRESILSISNASLKSTDYSFESNNRAIRKRNKWRILSIAASVVGILSLAGYLFILSEREREKDQFATYEENEIRLFGKEINLSESTKIYEIKGEGVAFTEDSIKVIVRDVASMEALVKFRKSFSFDSIQGEDQNVKSSQQVVSNRYVLDSLNSLEKYLKSISNTYSYNPAKKIITLNISVSDSVFGIYRYSKSGNKPLISIKINNIFYNIKPGPTIFPLEKVIDEKSLDILKNIDNSHKKKMMGQLDCIDSENQFYTYFENLNGSQGELEGIWELDNYVETWYNKKIIRTDTFPQISTWALFQITPNKYKVCDLNKASFGEKTGEDFNAFIEKISDKFIYSCHFLKENSHVTSPLLFQNINYFQTEYALPEAMQKRYTAIVNKTMIKWKFKWKRVFPQL